MKGDVVELQEMRIRNADEDADANDPLIAQLGDSGSTQEQDEDGKTGEQNEAQIPFRRAGRAVWLVTFSAGISGLLFGYDTGVISSTLVSIGSDLSHRPLTTLDKSLITAITSLFALLSAPTTGYLADRYGRRFVILVANLLFILGAIIQAASFYVPMMVVGRAAVGAAVGLASCATPLYITELSPAAMRGRLVTIQSLFITGGQVVAYLIGWVFAHLPAGWRWMVGLGAAPAIAQLFLLTLMFETPRWLVKAGQQSRARVVLQKVYGGLPEHERDLSVEHVLASIQSEIAEETHLPNGNLPNHPDANPGSIFRDTTIHLFHVPGNRRALTIACMLQALQQLCGFNSLMYLAPVGNTQEPVNYSNGSPWPPTLLLSMTMYVAAYAIGLGCVPWQQSELFPLRVRSLGSGIATATNWSSNFVIGISFLPMMEVVGPSITFMLYAVVCLVGWFGVWKIYPETAGLELEGIGELLKDGFGVEKSVREFKERKAVKRVESEVDDAP